MEGKTNFSRRQKQFNGLTLTWLIPTPLFYDRSTPLTRRTNALSTSNVQIQYTSLFLLLYMINS